MFEFSKSQINQLEKRGISVANAKAMIANINQQNTTATFIDQQHWVMELSSLAQPIYNAMQNSTAMLQTIFKSPDLSQPQEWPLECLVFYPHLYLRIDKHLSKPLKLIKTALKSNNF